VKKGKRKGSQTASRSKYEKGANFAGSGKERIQGPLSPGEKEDAGLQKLILKEPRERECEAGGEHLEKERGIRPLRREELDCQEEEG